MDAVVEKFKKLYPSLNQSQIEAITTVEGPLLIVAGPGTGKTLTITLRTLYLLLTNKAKPEEIILTTFTEKAALELRDRLSLISRKLDFKADLHQLKIGTIHTICNSFIMKFLHHTPLKKGYVILDDLTQIFFLYENFDEIVPKTNGQISIKMVLKMGNHQRTNPLLKQNH
jgi:DNA helicase-2/ATP-dependent DNA helicase PcrA